MILFSCKDEVKLIYNRGLNQHSSSYYSTFIIQMNTTGLQLVDEMTNFVTIWSNKKVFLAGFTFLFHYSLSYFLTFNTFKHFAVWYQMTNKLGSHYLPIIKEILVYNNMTKRSFEFNKSLSTT